MRTTSSTIQALERLCAAADILLTRDGKHFVVHTAQMDDEPPRGKASAAALAHAVAALRDRPDFDELRDATQYDPGVNRNTLRPDVPTSGLAGWEEAELVRLAVTEVT